MSKRGVLLLLLSLSLNSGWTVAKPVVDCPKVILLSFSPYAHYKINVAAIVAEKLAQRNSDWLFYSPVINLKVFAEALPSTDFIDSYLSSMWQSLALAPECKPYVIGLGFYGDYPEGFPLGTRVRVEKFLINNFCLGKSLCFALDGNLAERNKIFAMNWQPETCTQGDPSILLANQKLPTKAIQIIYKDLEFNMGDYVTGANYFCNWLAFALNKKFADRGGFMHVNDSEAATVNSVEDFIHCLAD